MRKISVLWVILAIFSFAIMSGGCGGDSGSGNGTFNSIVGFEKFKAEVDEKFDSPPFRVGIFIGAADGKTTRQWPDSPPAEREFGIPKNAEFVGIVFQIENVEGSDENFKDWVTLREAFIYNDKSSPEALRNFNRFKNVRVELDGLEADFRFFVNDEEADAEMMLLGSTYYPALPPNIPQDTRSGTRDTHIGPLPADVVSLVNAIPGNGTAYEISIGEAFGLFTHDNWGNHIQGFGYWNNELFLTHSDLDSGVIYRYWNESGTGKHRSELDKIWHDYNHPGGVQVIGDYLLLSAAEEAHGKNSKGAVISHYLPNFPGEGLLFERAGDAYTNSAVGITDVNPSLRYRPEDWDDKDWENTGSKKYIIGIVNYDKYQVEIRHFHKTTSLGNLNGDHTLLEIITIENPPGKFNNMNLFRDVDDDIWMIAFLEEGDTSRYTNMYVYKLTEPNPSGNGKRFLRSVSPAADPKRLTAVTPESVHINGRYGASCHFDGENLHVFISQRNASYLSGDEVGRVYYNHWVSD
ncbi:MAG: hypothetical protein FWG71_06170 [Synergistaceae bacterium]|nr:hypothetical protein [Synergistaceae bacterium]